MIRNYTPEEMNGEAQNWKIVQDNRNVIYIANQKGVIEYDGINWSLIDISGGKPAYTLTKHSDGTIYVGSEGDFGKLWPDANGKMEFRSLIDTTITELIDFSSRIDQVLFTDNLIYFETSRSRIIYDAVLDELELLDFPDSLCCFKGSIINGIYCTSDYESGLFRIENDSFFLMPNGRFFVDKAIVKMLMRSNNSCLVFTEECGIFNYNIQTGAVNQVTVNKTLNNDIRENSLYEVVEHNTGDIELNTLFGGSYILSSELEVKRFFNKASGLRDEVIISYLSDNNENIWYSLNSGISHLHFSLPIWKIGEIQNLKGLVWDIEVGEKFLLAATSNGLFLSDLSEMQPSFTEMLNNEGKSFGSTITIQSIGKTEFEQRIVIGTMRGGYIISINSELPNKYEVYEDIAEEKYSYGKILQSKFDPLCFYSVLIGAIYQNKLSENQIKVKGRIHTKDFTYNLTETNENIVWSILNRKILLKYDFNEQVRRQYDFGENNVSKNNIINSLYFKENELYILCSQGIYRYSEEKDTILKSKLFKELDILNEKNIIYCQDDSDGRTYIGYHEADNGIEKYYHGVIIKVDSLRNKFFRFSELPSKTTTKILPGSNGITWYEFGKDIYTLDVDKYINEVEKRQLKNKSTCLIRNISFADSILIYGGSDLTLLANLELPFAQRNMKIEWAYPYYFQEEKTQSRYHLTKRKLIQDSHWDRVNEVQLMNLRPGAYNFTVEAITVTGEISFPASFNFRILPPWFMKWYMYLLYTIILLYLIRLSFKIYSRKLIRDKSRLESIVTERTAEINCQKELIEQKNHQITGSINYAKHIQDSILLSPEEYKQIYERVMIYFRPRDIVSGDFYWFHRDGDLLFVAAVDCTGHGVPGAFMSMIGNTLLNDIIIDKKEHEPADILFRLHTMVKDTLHQESSSDGASDGMDMSLIILDLKSGALKFAGAKNCIYLVHGNEIEKLEPSPWSIGGLSSKSRLGKKVKFTQEECTISKSTSIYLFSDGYMDQFKKDTEEKFSRKRFEELLISTSKLDLDKQDDHFSSTMSNWKGELVPLDDMLIIGIQY